LTVSACYLPIRAKDLSAPRYREELGYKDTRSKNVKVENNESDRRGYGKERDREACERAWKRQKGRCILTRNGGWEHLLGKENRVEETGFTGIKTLWMKMEKTQRYG
jgi:hypothetical protein